MNESNNSIKSKQLTTKKVATLGVLCALSLISFMLENLLPPLFLPGAKLGLSNIFTLFTLILYSPLEALILIVVRTTLGCIIVGNISALIYSLCAGIASIVISSILLYTAFPKISIVSISVASAVVHNIVQTLIFCLIINSFSMIVYLPYFALIGIFSGLVIGSIVYLTINKLPISFFDKILATNNSKE